MAASIPVTVSSNTAAAGGSFMTVTGVAGNQVDIGSVMAGQSSMPGSNGTIAQVVGQQGEVQSNSQPVAQNAAATTTYLQLCAVTLTPGVWAISGATQLNTASSTLTQTSNAQVAISTTTASQAGSVAGLSLFQLTQGGMTGTLSDSWSIPPFQVSITVATTYFLNVNATYTAGTPTWVGSLYCERVR